METFFSFQDFFRPGHGPLSHLEAEPVEPSWCDFCRSTYGEPEVEVRIGTSTMGGMKGICPDCLRKGPKAIAKMVRRIASHKNQLGKLVRPLMRLDSFKEIPGGITTMKIVEAYEEINEARRKKTAA